MKDKGFLKTAWKKTIVSLDNKLADKIEQYADKVRYEVSQSKEPSSFTCLQWVLASALKNDVVKVRNRFDF